MQVHEQNTTNLTYDSEEARFTVQDVLDMAVDLKMRKVPVSGRVILSGTRRLNVQFTK